MILPERPERNEGSNKLEPWSNAPTRDVDLVKVIND